MKRLEQKVKELAREVGADLVGIAPVEVYSEYADEARARAEETGASLKDFMISEEDTSFFERLSDPRATLPSVRAVVLLGVCAFDEVAARGPVPSEEERGKLARIYSYYPVVRDIAEKLQRFLVGLGYEAVHGQHVPLKYAAHRLGLGAYGKNGILLTRDFGSFVAFRNVLTNAPLKADSLERPSVCTDCDLCLEACPTGALYAPFKVNPRLCVNPVSRKDDDVPRELRPLMQNWISGCDICQEVCPVNQALVPKPVDPRAGFDSRHHSSHQHLDGLERWPRLIPLLDEGTPPRIRRNAEIALENLRISKSE